MTKNKREQLSGAREQEARETVAIELNNPRLMQMTSTPGLLPLEQVPAERRQDKDFKETVKYFGWPSKRDELSISAVTPYVSNSNFIADVRIDTSDPFSPRIGNFIALLSSRPTLEPIAANESSLAEAMYSRTPVLHRFHALLPEFSAALQELIYDMRLRNSANLRDFENEFTLGKNTSLVTAARISHTIMGRLLTVSDRRLHTALAFPDAKTDTVRDVTDATIELQA